MRMRLRAVMARAKFSACLNLGVLASLLGDLADWLDSRAVSGVKSAIAILDEAEEMV